MAFRRRADGGPLIMVFGSFLSSSKKVKIGPPLTKLSGSAHVVHTLIKRRIMRHFMFAKVPVYQYPDWNGVNLIKVTYKINRVGSRNFFSARFNNKMTQSKTLYLYLRKLTIKLSRLTITLNVYLLKFLVFNSLQPGYCSCFCCRLLIFFKKINNLFF